MTEPFNLDPPFDSVETRLPIEALMSEERYKMRRDLFLQGFAKVQQKNFKDHNSFYAVAGIHGLPGPSYCEHGTILFPTWHRTYVSLLEMLIYNEASSIVEEYPECVKKQEYKNELSKVRFPYWDWASSSVLCLGIPSILFQERVDVNTLRKPNEELTITIRNPLRAYTLPKDLGTLKLVGDTSNPTQRPYIPHIETHPYTPVGYATVRHPNKNYLSDVKSTNFDIITSCNSTFRPSIWYLFMSVTDWNHFSNHSSGWTDDGDFRIYSSIEGVHDAVHIKIGGTGGHMAYVPTAGFDPIFYLHHANVDRLTAIWQAINPDSWMIEQDGKDENTPLQPFYNVNEHRYWTSLDIRNITALKYTYPELIGDPDPQTLKNDMLIYYQPTPIPSLSTFVYKIFARVKRKNYVDTSFEIQAFIDLPDSNSASVTSPHFAGSMSIFARDSTTTCATCEEDSEKSINGSIDITACMQRLHLINEKNKEKWGPYLPGDRKNNGKELHDRITLIAVLLDGSKISHRCAGLEKAHCWELKINNYYDPKPIEHTPLGDIEQLF